MRLKLIALAALLTFAPEAIAGPKTVHVVAPSSRACAALSSTPSALMACEILGIVPPILPAMLVPSPNLVAGALTLTGDLHLPLGAVIDEGNGSGDLNLRSGTSGGNAVVITGGGGASNDGWRFVGTGGTTAAIQFRGATNGFYFQDASNNSLSTIDARGGMFLSSSLTVVAGSGSATANAVLDQSGQLLFTNATTATTPAGATVAIGRINGASDLVLNVPTGRAVFLRGNGTNMFSVSAASVSAAGNIIVGSGSGFSAVATDAARLVGRVNDGGSAVGAIVNNDVSLTTTAKLLSVQNNSTEKAYVQQDGLIATASHINLLNDGFGIQQNGGTAALFESIQAKPTNLGKQVAVNHLSGGSPIPTSATAGTGCGTSSSPSVTAGSDDLTGVLHVVCGSGGTTTNLIVSATWGGGAYNSVPKCTWRPITAATAAIMISAQIIDGSTTAAVGVKCGGGTCPTATLDLGYTCIQ